MRIHDRYVLRLFLKVLFFALVSFVILFVLADLFEKMDSFIDNQAHVLIVTRLYLYKVPDIVRLTLPIDVLLATIFALGVMAKNNELVALLSSGVSMLRISAPILALACLASVASALLSEFIVPVTNSRQLEVQRVDIEHRPPRDAPIRRNFAYRNPKGYLYFVRTFNTEGGTLAGVSVYRYSEGRLVARLDAENAVWQADHWLFQEGFYRTFAGTSESARHFVTLQLPDLVDPPNDMARLEPEADAMSYRQLRNYVRKVRDSGGRVDRYLVLLFNKVSDPFTNIVLAVLGIGLGARKRKTSLAAGFGMTLAIGFSYLAVTQLSSALGENETIPPHLAAWLGVLLFGTAGLALLIRVNR